MPTLKTEVETDYLASTQPHTCQVYKKVEVEVAEGFPEECAPWACPFLGSYIPFTSGLVRGASLPPWRVCCASRH